ncbi:hypothetical protein OPV22_030502 [Ensete ventricosum]|uniref:Uncharacterized protein n=1 Tax=Ensete ventricosum TaxID=4639 RepID=A0AAV8Q980_ENSVE|nr:hypothetical protein OPV22_030502 [Ensete ventricosum]
MKGLRATAVEEAAKAAIEEEERKMVVGAATMWLRLEREQEMTTTRDDNNVARGQRQQRVMWERAVARIWQAIVVHGWAATTDL